VLKCRRQNGRKIEKEEPILGEGLTKGRVRKSSGDSEGGGVLRTNKKREREELPIVKERKDHLLQKLITPEKSPIPRPWKEERL